MPSLETVNKERERLGLPALDKLATEAKPTEASTTPVENVVESEKTEKPPVNAELSDEQLLELLKKRNIKVPTAEQEVVKTPEQISEEREAQKLSYGLTKGLFNKKDYETFVTDSNSKESIVFAQYLQEAKAEDPALTDDEIKEEFVSKYGLDAEPNTRKNKRGQEEINLISEKILKNKHKKIFEADSAFSQYEDQAKEASEYQKNITSKAPAYKQTIEDVFGDLKKITAKFKQDDSGDEESYDVDLVAENINSLKEKYLQPIAIENAINAGLSKEVIARAAYNEMLASNFPYIAKEMINQALRKKQAGVKGIIPPMNSKKAIEENDKKLTPQQRQMRDELKGIPQPLTN